MPIHRLTRAALLFAALPFTLHAANIAWDISPGTAGAGNSTVTGGTGVWNLANGNWTIDSGANNIVWDNVANAGDIAVLGGAGGTVTIDNGGAAINARGVTFSVTGYTLAGQSAGDTLNFGASQGSITATAASQATISANLAGTAGLAIAASGSLTPTGSGSLDQFTLSGDNSLLSGGITITAGLVSIGSQNSVGANAITLSNGGVLFTGGTSSLNNNFVLTNTGTIRTYSAATVTLSGTLSGSGNLNKSDSGALSLTGQATYSGTTNVVGSLTINNALSNIGSTASGVSTVGDAGAGSAASALNLQAGTFNANRLNLTASNSGTSGTSTVNVSGGTMNIGSGGIKVGNNTGTATLQPASTFNQSGGAVTNTGGLWIGDASTQSPGIANLSGGSYTDASNIVIGTRSTGTLTISGSANVTALGISYGHSAVTPATAVATLNLNGGTFSVGGVYKPGTQASTGVFNFNGGTVRATANNAFFLFANNGGTAQASGLTNFRANIRNGGALIDTNGFNITIGAALLHSNVGGDNAIDGGLTKSGSGTLTLAASNTYTGATLVNAGSLVASNASALGNAGAVTVNGGSLVVMTGVTNVASLVVNTGALSTVSGSITLSGAFSLVGGIWSVGNSADGVTAGSFTLSGGQIDLSNFTNKSVAGTYSLISGSGSSELSNDAFINGDSGYAYAINSAGDIVVTAVPEPAACGLIGAGSLVAITFVRRRVRRKGATA